MECPYCGFDSTDVTDSRPTYQSSQVWRRRRCLDCKKIFTTYEKALINFMRVRKKDGKIERYSRAKVYSGIYGSFLRVPAKENTVDKLTDQVEARLLKLHKKIIDSQAVADIVLPILRKENMAGFVRFLSRQQNIDSEQKLMQSLKKYGIRTQA